MKETEAVVLRPMTRELCHTLYRHFERDPETFMDMSLFEPFVYDAQWVDSYFDKQQRLGRVVFAIMYGQRVVGEVKLLNIDREARECVLGIHLQNDAVKNRGIGTRAERLALRYAFDELKMQTVKADAVLKNVRSQHVLEKVGFKLIGQDEMYRYYRCEKNSFKT